MATASQVDIKVIYDGRSRRGPSRPYSSAGSKRRSTGWLVIGGLNLVAAAVLCYVACWHIDRDFLYEKLILKTPLPGVDADDAADMLFPRLTAKAGGERLLPAVESASPQSHRLSAATAQVLIPATAYSWLTLAVVASCALALAGGAACARIGGVMLRRIGMIVALVTILILAWQAHAVWAEYGMQYPTGKWRAGMGGLVFVSALVAFTIGRAPRGLTRLAGVALILLAVASVVGLYLGAQCEAVELKATLGKPLTILFIASQALWGLLLLPIASRTGR